jgi:N-acetylmuramoyl-L-alanine amidase/LysM repeat protein
MAKKKVGIDIGHGENTFNNGSKGVRKNGVGYEEHHFNATVGNIVNARLKELGFDTVMAQPAFKNDVALTTRTNKYNAEKCDIVVSIHANAGVASANGACAFYWHTSASGKKLAETFGRNFKAMVDGVDLHGNGLHASQRGSWTNLHMVRETNMVAILVECGFMTNSNDFEYIFGKHSKKYREEVAEAIVKTVCDYFGVKYQEPKEDAPHTAPELSDGDYKIQRGDTFWSIARDFKVSVDALQKANPKVNARALKIGSYINIPNGKYVAHKIVKGDTLWGLGEKYKVSVDAIKGANKGIDVYALQIGDTVKIPTVEVPKPKGDQKTNSIVTYLNSIGVSSSFSNREKLAKQHGISGYRGTASQNLLLLKKMRGH